MLSCKETTKLVSESLDHPLPLSKQISVWIHRSMCQLCSAFRRNQVVLKERIPNEAERWTSEEMSNVVKLSDAAKQKIAQAMPPHG
ncbi:hypothetical protein Pla52o_15950 [Novipirellula galeiformis]|uniref:Zinc-finger domain-containing protein n=1 Tax=Novipirellula galeiformis TaxID=2528004 RepID=A0A5C6CQC8_9BACT|nr:hypothetical protein Pla52o_15950 [Novipirellula galeiformis]